MIGVIADDLTGAAEIGAVGVRHGLGAEIVLSGQPDGEAGLICLDTDSRSSNAKEASRRAASAAQSLDHGGADWIYKKVDSLLRGNVIAEVEAVMKELRMKRALIIPANPSLGRVIAGGCYFIHGKPLHKTEFAHDPEHPRISARVLECVAQAKHCPVQVCGPNHPMPASGIVIGEAGSEGDLNFWAARRKKGILLAGAAEFFAALLKAGGHALAPTVAPMATPMCDAREFFVCGTASRSSRPLERAARARHARVFSLLAELARGAGFSRAAMEALAGKIIIAFKSNERVVLKIGLPPARDPIIARELSRHLIQVAERVLRQIEVGRVYAEGGATAAALTRQMGWRRLTVRRECAPGVAALAVEGNQSILLTIKPGSYAWPSGILKGTTA